MISIAVCIFTSNLALCANTADAYVVTVYVQVVEVY